MAKYNIEINRYNGSDYDTLYPTPAAHAESHGANGDDPIVVDAANINNNAVTTNKISNGAVTRSKIGAGAVSADKIGYGTLSQRPTSGSFVGQMFLVKVE